MKSKRSIQGMAIVMLVCIVITSVFANPVTVWANLSVSGNEIEAVKTVSDNQAETEIAVVNVQAEAERETGQVSENDSETPSVEKVTGVSVESASYRSLKISYKAVYGAKGYEIYRGTKKDDMKMVADLSAVRTSYVDKGEAKTYLATNTKYYYKVRAYILDEKEQKVYGEFSKTVSGKPKLNAPKMSMAETLSYKSVKITYSKVSGASGYVIYRSTKKDSGFKKIGSVKKKKTVQFTDKKCKTGIKYYYKVRAYRTVNGKNKYGPYSDVISAKTKLNTPKLQGITVTSPDTALVTWKKVSGASGYYIYRCDKKKGKYKKVLRVKGAATVQAYVGGQENGKTYYYKVRAYRTVDKKKKYSSYSNIKSAVFNMLASENETYQDKAQRIFGLPYYKKYATKEEADRHMTTITVDVWDFASDGVTKITKQRSIVVHQNIAPTVQQIFKEIYEGQERFPIKNVGGYSWRGESSNSEHCCGVAIDINWEENYLIDNGVIISGKCYEPGVNPYSIPTDGEVARIMKKYGFRQGIWGNRCDYMHFSYFGT
jgi:hypothetical protein